MDGYCTTTDVAKLFKLTTAYVCVLCKENKLPAIRIGGTWRIPNRAVEEIKKNGLLFSWKEEKC